jgi:hypothetical protein
MIRSPILDPTAGESARLIHELPTMPRPIVDPTDPRHGLALDWRGGYGRRLDRRETDTHVVDFDA